MDNCCIRIPGTLRWVPRYLTDNRIEDLRPLFRGKICYIIGKGPSLDHLRAEHFPDLDAPIIALNEAIFSIEALEISNPIFGLQQDAKLRATCLPKRSPLLVSTKAANYYATYSKAYIFQNTELNLHRNALSVSAAITIARRLETKKFVLICFDACVNKNVSYAKCVGYEPTWGGAPKRFLSHRAKIIKHALRAPIDWIIPLPSLAIPVVEIADRL